MSKENTVNK